MSTTALPNEYGLDHEEFRPGQYEAIQIAQGMNDNDIFILEAPTGSGKTAVARAMSSTGVTALCRTKALQISNYRDTYGFDALFGKGNYPCALNSGLSAGSCAFADVGMYKCPSLGSCEYMQAKEIAKTSSHRSLNYAYWLTARWPKKDPTDYVFLDEAHLLSDIVLE